MDAKRLTTMLVAAGVDERTAERFASKVTFGPKCWEWNAARNTGGYGVFGIKRDGKWTTSVAHRFLFTHLVAQPTGDIDHLCRNPPCVRPDHLEDVTHAENIRRGDLHWRDKTHCKNGHPFEGNTLWVTTRSGGKARQCRACTRERTREINRRKRESSRM